jgi:group I intron endonuclease
MHENRINGKRYIGITSQKPTNRWRNGSGYDKQPRFYAAIQKYGWDAFRHDILYTGLTQEEAERLEIQLIDKYETLNEDKGYNLSPGGVIFMPTDETRAKQSEARKGWVPSEETRKRMSVAKRGKPLSEEHRAHLSAAHIGRTSPNKGKTLTLECREKMSLSRKGVPKSEAHRQKLAETARERERRKRESKAVSLDG